MKNIEIESSSFRDPSGFLFRKDGILYRQINQSYKENYNCLMDSGLYKELVDSELLISHTEINLSSLLQDKGYKIIQPDLISFISYPYEWCFQIPNQNHLLYVVQDNYALELM